MKQRDSCAASAGVSGGHSRVLLAPMIGALHMMPKAIRLGSGASMIVVNDAPGVTTVRRFLQEECVPTWRLRDAAVGWR